MKQFFDAIQAGDAAAVQSLLDSEPALVDAVNEKGLNAFTVAKYSRKDDIAKLLLERGAQLDIHSAAMTGDHARVQTLVAADPALAKAFSHDGWTPLHLAAFFGHVDAAKALIAAGANVNERGTNAMSNMPLHAAAAGRKVDMVILLVENGASVNARQHGGWTALHAAAQNGDLHIVHVLIGSGADVKAAAENNQTALDLAILKGNQDMVDLLEHYGAGE